VVDSRKIGVRSILIAQADHLLHPPAGTAHSLHRLADDPPHRREMDAKFLRDRLIAVGPGLVRRPYRVVPILVLPSYRAELRCRAPSLHLRNVNILGSFPKLAPHLLDKILLPQINLPLEIFPDALGSHSICDKFFILPSSPSPALAELRQNYIAAEPRWCRRRSDRRAVTAPRPEPGMLDHGRPHWIEHDVAAKLHKISVPVNEDGFVAALKQMTAALVTAVGPLSKHTVQLPHPFGQIALGGFDHEVVMIPHQAVSMAAPAKP